MPINKTVFATISRLLPHAQHTYRLQRIMDSATSHLESGLKRICDVQDVQLTLTDGTLMTVRVSTPLIPSEEYRYSELFQADKKTLKELARQRKEREKEEREASRHAHEDTHTDDSTLTDSSDSVQETTQTGSPEHPADGTATFGTGTADTADTAFADTTDTFPVDPEGKHAPELNGDILFIHGGGWATGSADLYTDVCTNLALQTQRRVFSVDYRLAPDYRYPTPLNDCLDAARAFFNGTMPVPTVPGAPKTIDPKTAMLFGDSAGGNLCAALALKGRDTGDFTVPTMILLYPCLNNDYNMATSPYDSVRENGKDYLLTAQDMADYLNMYRSNIHDLFDPYFAPLNEQDLSNQPRTLIISAEYCPLRDEDEEYALLLEKAGNSVECCRIRDGVHGYIMYPRISPLVTNTYKIIDHFLDPDNAKVQETYKEGKEQQSWQRIVGTD